MKIDDDDNITRDGDAAEDSDTEIKTVMQLSS
jgi:hypothetical protein